MLLSTFFHFFHIMIMRWFLFVHLWFNYAKTTEMIFMQFRKTYPLYLDISDIFWYLFLFQDSWFLVKFFINNNASINLTLMATGLVSIESISCNQGYSTPVVTIFYYSAIRCPFSIQCTSNRFILIITLRIIVSF